jgi:hypothetical protein
MPGSHGSPINEMKNSHINTSSRLGRKIPIIIYIIKHFIPARQDELFSFEHAYMSLLQQKYDVKHLNGFIPAMYFVQFVCV